MKFKRWVALGLVLAGCEDEEILDGPREGTVHSNAVEDGAIRDAAADDDAVHDAATGDPALPGQTYKLCDGSDSIRLSLLESGGGEMAESYLFTAANGWRFLHVDGHCNFVASPRAGGRLWTGTFSAEQGRLLGELLGLAHIDGVVYRFAGRCVDSPTRTVLTPTSYLQSGGCGDEYQAPTEVAAALDWDRAFVMATAAGTRSRGPISVLVLTSTAPQDDAVSWPFAFPIEQALVVGEERARASDALRRGKVLTGADAVLAREVWDAGGELAERNGLVFVTSGGRSYELYFRDELDPAFADKVSTFRTRHHPDGRPIARCDAKRVTSLELMQPGVHGRFVNATISASAPCGTELCWDGSFEERIPIATNLALQAPPESRMCLGTRSLTVSADLQPMIDAYCAFYPRSSVEIDLRYGTLRDGEGSGSLALRGAPECVTRQ